ncbi:MAG: 6-phosphogluconolactonase [Pseudomonadales bacterium]
MNKPDTIQQNDFPNLCHYADNTTLVTELAERIAQILEQAIAQHGRATMAVSGGSTPIPLFEKLSLAVIDWDKVVITLVDERWVEPDHEDSNEALVHRHLLKNNAASAEFIGLKVSCNTPFLGEQAVANRLRRFDGAFDVLVLGMGNDGHTASLFTDGEPLQYALEPRQGEPCCGMVRGDLEHPRITLTLPRILNSRYLFLHTVGDSKLELLKAAQQPGSINELPIRAVLNQHQTPLYLYHAAQE